MRKKIIFISILSFICTLLNAHAYDWEKCRRSLAKKGKEAEMYGGLYTTTVFPVQFSSSWGACSAFGKPEVDRKAFFNDNFDSLRVNFSENRGEYMHALISFYQCSNVGEEEFIKLVRSNYQNIFGKIYNKETIDLLYPDRRSKARENWQESWDVTPEESFNRLQEITRKDINLNKECKKM